jgi:NAD(P)-dependent dehydrogenase (short-subunit alcohol dehydrogenase family)
MSYEGRTAIIFGGSSGIGRACVEALAIHGWTIAIADVDEAGGGATVTAVGKEGGTASFVPADITNEDSVRNAVAETVRRYGAINAMVTSAGASVGGEGAEGWELALDFYVKGPFYASLHTLPELERNGGGSITHIGSLASIRGSVFGGVEQSGYPTAKHGLLGLTKTMALTYGAKNIRVNAVCPGYIKTNLTRRLYEDPDSDTFVKETLRVPLGRWGEAAEIGKVVAFLASDDASYLTGQAIVVDGGMTAR